MQYSNIHLKYMAFFFILSLSWIAHDLHSAIHSSGTALFTNANSSSLKGFVSPVYGLNPIGRIPFGPPWPPIDPKAHQIQWGTAFDSEIQNCGIGMQVGCVSAYTVELEHISPVALGVPFVVTEITHINRRIVGSLITFFNIDLLVTLDIDGAIIPIPPSVFSHITLSHDETRNPAADIATWASGSITYDFQHSNVNYQLVLTGIDPNSDPSCAGQCFITAENDETTIPIFATLNGTPVPEPSTYLLLGSMVGFVTFLRYRKTRESERKILKQRQNK